MNMYGSGLNNHTEAVTNSIRNKAVVEEIYKDDVSTELNVKKKPSLWSKILKIFNNKEK